MRITQLMIAGEKPITSSSRITIEDGLVTVNNVKAADKGDYLCEASNSLGQIVRTITLSLTGMESQHTRRLFFTTAYLHFREPVFCLILFTL